MTHSITRQYSTAGTSLIGTKAISGDTEQNSDITLAPSATNVELDFAFVGSKVLALGILCVGDCVIKTNTTGGADTVTLTAGQVTLCASNAEVLLLFPTADVTKLFLTSTAGGVFSIRALIHEGP